MHVSLPMYDFSSVRDATDRYWQAIRDAFGQGPQTLCRGKSVWDAWQHPELLLSQTCGFPYRARLHGKVTIVGTPDYGLPGCAPGEYNSVFVARRDDARRVLADFQGATFAFNSATSQSGWAAPILHARGQDVRFGATVRTGAHVASAKAVADARADIAGLDALSWRFIQKEEAFSIDLVAIETTAPTPGLPYITGYGAERERLFSAISDGIASISQVDRTALCLNGLVAIDAERYLSVPAPAPPKT